MSQQMHPRPDRARRGWHSLDGAWDIFFDDAESWTFERVNEADPFGTVISVPFPYQAPLSGVHDSRYHPSLWYRKRFDRPPEFDRSGALLHFGAVDYHADIWLNGEQLGVHRGGYAPFHFDVSDKLRDRDNVLIVRAIDRNSVEQPRGKQTWSTPAEVWYTPISGIWQSVWLESIGTAYASGIRVDADPETGDLRIHVHPSRVFDGRLAVSIGDGDRVIAEAEAVMRYPVTTQTVRVSEPNRWSPDSPSLYDIEIRLIDSGGVEQDVVDTYIGFRSISVADGAVYLNDEPCYMNLVLDQGYWEEGLYTPPSSGALQQDIELAKSMGFNGCRKHMKVEDPRFLYWADRLGFLVWSEFPAVFAFTASAREQFLVEWLATMRRDAGHPAIVAWVPYNESWGIPDVAHDPDVQEWVREVVRITRSIDSTRLVIDNDGWEHVESDIMSYHDYSCDNTELDSGYQSAVAGGVVPGSARKTVVGGSRDDDKPLMLTEYGGVAYLAEADPDGSWGYGKTEESADSYRARLEATITTVSRMEGLAGAVYTQLTDVEQEKNGLLTARREPKLPLDEIRDLFERLTGGEDDV